MNTDLAAQKALDRLANLGFEKLTEEERIVATAWLFVAGVSNNGFARYYRSKRGDLAFNAPAALGAIGAVRLAGIAAEANAVFGVDGPPRECRSRRSLLKSLPASALQVFAPLEQRYFDCEDDADALLEKFLSTQKW